MTKRRTLIIVLLLAAFAVLPLVAQQQADRVKTVGGKYQCMCSCGQVLTQCNHVGCTISASMLKDLGTWVARGDSDETIAKAWVAEFGTLVFAEPPKSGFSLVAWAMPGVYFLVGLGIVIFVISRWTKRGAGRTPAVAMAGAAGVSSEALERARAQAARETED